MTLEAVLLDAGGVLVNPNWLRVSQALADQGVRADPALLAAGDNPPVAGGRRAP